jgi:hypothetical protein
MLAGLWEARAQQHNKIPYVFPNRNGVGRIVNMRKSWDRALKKVGLEGKIYHTSIIRIFPFFSTGLTFPC